MGDSIDADARQRIEAKIKEIRDNLQSEDAAQLRRLTEELQAAWHQVSEQVYARAAQQAGASRDGGSGDASAGDEEVVDAEVVDGDDK